MNLLVSLGRNVSRVGGFLFKNYPVITNCVVSGSLMMGGDVIAQFAVEKRRWKNFEWKRTIRMGSFGVAMTPLWYYWYVFLARYFKSTQIGRKILLDEGIASPVNYTIFFTTTGLMEGRSLDECKAELRNKFLVTYMADLCVWIPVMYVNFKYIPLHYQVAYIELMLLVWSSFLSLIKNNDLAFLEGFIHKDESHNE